MYDLEDPAGNRINHININDLRPFYSRPSLNTEDVEEVNQRALIPSTSRGEDANGVTKDYRVAGTKSNAGGILERGNRRDVSNTNRKTQRDSTSRILTHQLSSSLYPKPGRKVDADGGYQTGNSGTEVIKTISSTTGYNSRSPRSEFTAQTLHHLPIPPNPSQSTTRGRGRPRRVPVLYSPGVNDHLSIANRLHPRPCNRR